MEIKVESDMLVIRVPVGASAIQSAPFSSTGKTRLVGSTRGIQSVANGATLLGVSVNVTTKA